ncbi:unnamed protein product [Closterium sp. Naga37s-1]|nr:unnamed protein product [Closterium sp. Naga37s-1]
MLTLMLLPFPPLSTPSSDISNNSFYGPINSNFRSMIPDNGALLNIAGNFFYGDPMLYADGCQFCPSNVTQSHLLDLSELGFPGKSRCALRFMQGYLTDIAQTADKHGEASLRGNCFTLNKQMECTANETQCSNDECLAFCSLSRELGPCDRHGACVPPQAGAAEARFTCECDDGFVPTNGTLGSTCARPAPPPAACMLSLSTGAVVGIAVGSAAAFALLLALVVTLLWPRQRSAGVASLRHENDPLTPFLLHENVPFNSLFSSPLAPLYPPVRQVRAMASLRHEHVVRLLGFCLHQNVESGQQEQILVYEFVPNGDLKYHIHDSKSKPCEEENRWSSFGVVLLELLTRQKAAVEGTGSHISDWVSAATLAARKVQVYELGELKDAGLEAPDEAVVELADIALDCLKMPASRRPNMKDVARRLQNLLSRYCSDDANHSSLAKPSLRMVGTPRGESISRDTFGRSDWSEATSGASKLTHSLSEKWRMIE